MSDIHNMEIVEAKNFHPDVPDGCCRVECRDCEWTGVWIGDGDEVTAKEAIEQVYTILQENGHGNIGTGGPAPIGRL